MFDIIDSHDSVIQFVNAGNENAPWLCLSKQSCYLFFLLVDVNEQSPLEIDYNSLFLSDKTKMSYNLFDMLMENSLGNSGGEKSRSWLLSTKFWQNFITWHDFRHRTWLAVFIHF